VAVDISTGDLSTDSSPANLLWMLATMSPCDLMPPNASASRRLPWQPARGNQRGISCAITILYCHLFLQEKIKSDVIVVNIYLIF
jgi:hypothetical protein